MPPLFSGWGGFFMPVLTLKEASGKKWKKNGNEIPLNGAYSHKGRARVVEKWKKNLRSFYKNREIAKYKMVNRQ